MVVFLIAVGNYSNRHDKNQLIPAEDSSLSSQHQKIFYFQPGF